MFLLIIDRLSARLRHSKDFFPQGRRKVFHQRHGIDFKGEQLVGAEKLEMNQMLKCEKLIIKIFQAWKMFHSP